MDFLSNYVVHLDFDRGRMTLSRSAGREPGQALAMRVERGIPWVEARVTSTGPGTWFNIDTGYGSGGSGGLDRVTYCLLKMLGVLSPAGQAVAGTLAGDVEHHQGCLEHLQLGPFEHRCVYLSEDADISRLGLHFWSRYRVTFDFPAGVAYLHPGRGHTTPDALDSSGLRLVRRQGQIVVDCVTRGSPAAVAGICKGDEVVQVADLPADRTSLAVLRRVLATEKGTMAITIRRDSAVREVMLWLEKTWRTAKPAP
jgi:hypothetical protein